MKCLMITAIRVRIIFQHLIRTFSAPLCDFRAFLKYSAEIVFQLEGKNSSVILQGKCSSNGRHLLCIGTTFESYSPKFLKRRCYSFVTDAMLLCLHLCRGRRPRPELRGFLLGAAHARPSLSQPRGLPEPGAEGVGDGRPSLFGSMQPLKEE